jgi:hypothetical protein
MMHSHVTPQGARYRCLAALVGAAVALSASGCSRKPAHRSFAAPEDAVRALAAAVKAGNTDEVIAIFGPGSADLIDTSDAAAARRNRQVFAVAFRESWRLVDENNGKVLVVGNESWPFPVPLVKGADGWQFDSAAGKEEVTARRIGRNEIAAIRICRTYVGAQRLYAALGHDGKPAGLYAAKFRSDPGSQNGLYWPASPGQKRSPLGDLVAQAAAEGRAAPAQGQEGQLPFHGYYFRILTGQGEAATGGARDYVRDGAMSGGFALVAWPATYDVTGVMTFIVNQDGTVREKDLGPGTDGAARAMTLYNPDGSWGIAE